MFRATLVACAATVSISATPVAATTVADVFSSLWVFGDSLSDNGNLSALTSATLGVDFPPPPYDDGRFTNGPVWNERFLDDFAPGRSGNYAFGGARAAPDTDGVPDLKLQVDTFLADAKTPALTLGDRPLAALFFAANDMFDAVRATATADPLDIPGILETATFNALTEIAMGVFDLFTTAGITDFALFNLPDLGLTPRLIDDGPAQAVGSAATAVYNLGFGEMVDTLEGFGLNIYTVDVFDLFMDAMDNPGDYGLTELETACLKVDPFTILTGTPVPAPCANPSAFLYWDQLHPTVVGHDALAMAFDAAVPAIPLPAPALLLIGALGGLAALRRRPA